ncbi:hypothetical protein EON80_20110 [bacterium]|nr:MAG: hypothetical protein EON80_20110 [bacterium]
MLLGPVPAVNAATQPDTSIRETLTKLKIECDNPNISNASEWTTSRSATERKRLTCIFALKAGDEAAVRQEIATAKGEYREMLTVALAACGDNSGIWQTSRLMLAAKTPAVRVCAASILRRLRDKRTIEPLKQALADPFERRDGTCVNPQMIFPVRRIASDALVASGLSLDEVRKLERTHLIAKLKAPLQDRTQAELTWTNLLGAVEKNQTSTPYIGQQVLLRGTLAKRNNPIQLKIDGSKATCLVMLTKRNADLLAKSGAAGFRLEIRGVVRSVDPDKKQIEVWTMAVEELAVAVLRD